MESFKIWILSLSGAIVITSLFKILLSGSSLKKVLNIFFSLFILFYTVIPLQGFDMDFDDINLSQSESDFDSAYKDAYESIIVTSVESVCKELQVEIISINIESEMDDDEFTVKNMEIDIDDNSKINETENKIKKDLGFEVTVK